MWDFTMKIKVIYRDVMTVRAQTPSGLQSTEVNTRSSSILRKYGGQSMFAECLRKEVTTKTW